MLVIASSQEKHANNEQFAPAPLVLSNGIISPFETSNIPFCNGQMPSTAFKHKLGNEYIMLSENELKF